MPVAALLKSVLVDVVRGVDASCPHGNSTTQDGPNIALMKARERSQRATRSLSRRTGGDVSNKQPNKGEYPKATLAVLCSCVLV